MSDEKTILLVEDNPDDVELAQRAFRKSAKVEEHLVVARDGAEVFEYLFATGRWEGRGPEGMPALVLLDLKLPKIDGLEVLRRLRSDPRTKFLPVVILTSSVEERDLVRGYELGCNSYLHKPVDFNQFVEAAELLEQYWLLLNEPPPRVAA